MLMAQTPPDERDQGVGWGRREPRPRRNRSGFVRRQTQSTIDPPTLDPDAEGESQHLVDKSRSMGTGKRLQGGAVGERRRALQWSMRFGGFGSSSDTSGSSSGAPVEVAYVNKSIPERCCMIARHWIDFEIN